MRIKPNFVIIIEFSKSDELFVLFHMENEWFFLFLARLINICEQYPFHTQVIGEKWVHLTLNTEGVCSSSNYVIGYNLISNVACGNSSLQMSVLISSINRNNLKDICYLCTWHIFFFHLEPLVKLWYGVLDRNIEFGHFFIGTII